MVRPPAEISSRTNDACQNTQKGSCGVNASAKKFLKEQKTDGYGLLGAF